MFIKNAAIALAMHVGLVMCQDKILITPSTTYQTMDGFGFSEAFGFGEVVQSAPSAQQTQALNYLFSTTTGAGFTILRNRIAATGDTIEPTSPGSPSATPKYSFNGNDDGQVFWSTKARAMGVKYIYADAWSAPGFMKTNDNYENGGSLCGTPGATCSSGDWRQAYANYLVQYIKYYAAAGITIDFVGFLNEPEYAPAYDSMLSNGAQSASFIPILYNTIKAAGLSTGVTCCDAEGWNDQVTYTANIISAGADKYLARITSHWYTSKGSSPINTSLRVWETEYGDLDDPFSSTWYSSGALNEGLTWANYLYQGVVESNLSAYLYWIGAQANSNAAALVSVNGSGSSTTVKPSGILWAFAMWSRYIRPDAVRIEITGALSTLKLAAFKNTDGSIVAIAINNGDSATSVTLGGITVASVSAHVMDNSVSAPATFATTLSGGTVAASLPARSVVTFVMTTGTSSAKLRMM